VSSPHQAGDGDGAPYGFNLDGATEGSRPEVAAPFPAMAAP
jgi:hypothetical protein